MKFTLSEGGPYAHIVDLESGGDMIMITGWNTETDWAQLRAWVQAEVLEYTETMTLEQVMKEREHDL